MIESRLKPYMARAGIRSNRELAELTGIAERTLDRLVRYPRNARGYQIQAIGQACGMTWEEIGQILSERGKS